MNNELPINPEGSILSSNATNEYSTELMILGGTDTSECSFEKSTIPLFILKRCHVLMAIISGESKTLQ